MKMVATVTNGQTEQPHSALKEILHVMPGVSMTTYSNRSQTLRLLIQESLKSSNITDESLIYLCIRYVHGNQKY